jgi:RNA polymerase sigma-70 factor (ECF subfamily)
VDAFFAAGRAGDFDALVSVLHPDVVTRVDLGPGGSKMTRGAAAVARRAGHGAATDTELHHVLVNGAAGVIVTRAGLPIAVMAFTIAADRIVEIDTIADPDRVTALAGPALAR